VGKKFVHYRIASCGRDTVIRLNADTQHDPEEKGEGCETRVNGGKGNRAVAKPTEGGKETRITWGDGNRKMKGSGSWVKIRTGGCPFRNCDDLNPDGLGGGIIREEFQAGTKVKRKLRENIGKRSIRHGKFPKNGRKKLHVQEVPNGGGTAQEST